MKKANQTKLQLQRDVLRVLQAPDLTRVAGGIALAGRPIKPSATTEAAGACCA